MLKIIAQYNNHRGPTATGEHKLTFDIQKEFAQSMYAVLQKLEKHPQVIMYLDILESKEQAEELVNETDEQKKVRLNKKIHVLFDQIANEKDITKAEVKEEIKTMMIKKDIIKKSLSELTIEQQLELIGDLDNMLLEEKFNED